MRSQKDFWSKEHKNHQTFVKIHSVRPSLPVVRFVYFLKGQGLDIKKASILDLGCGNGRNSLYLAKKGFNVLGIDFVSIAFPKNSKKLNNNLEFKEIDIIKKWPVLRDFDAIIDCNTTICIPNPGRDRTINSAYKVLKSGGYYLFYGVAPTKFIKINPGPEPNSTIFSKTGKFEKQYSRKELLDSYKKYKLIKLEKIKGGEIIEGRKINFSKWIAIFRKTQ